MTILSYPGTARSVAARAVRRARAVAMVVAVMLLATLILGAGTAPAHAASRVDVSENPRADGSTTVTLQGSGFQYQPNAPGGVYIFFGAVSDPGTNAWAPSQGGQSGSTFSYASTSGTQLLAAFEGGSSAESANAVIRPDGTWTATMTIPGARFAASFGDPHSGAAQTGSEIDCLQVMCGIITIGEHGAWNANNESFTPVSFVTGSGEVVQGSAAPSFDDDATIVDVPASGTEEQTVTDEQPADDTADAVETTVETAAAPVAEPEDQTMTYVVFAVLGVAVLALIAAIVFFFVRRAKERSAAMASVDSSAAAETSTPTEGQA